MESKIIEEYTPLGISSRRQYMKVRALSFTIVF